ncbi:MAG TPA: DoxX family protein [Microbacterium sp.]|nr:DoxX family protein [Microbacterium sp.]
MAEVMSGTVAAPAVGQDFWSRVRSDPAFAAFWILRVGFVVLPLWMGVDKFFNVLTEWPGYLAPWIVDLLPFSAQTAMYIVGVVEIIAGIAVAIKPRYASYVVALWLAAIIVTLLTYSGFYDVALRDFGLLVAALALSRLAAIYDTPWGASSTSRAARPM